MAVTDLFTKDVMIEAQAADICIAPIIHCLDESTKKPKQKLVKVTKHRPVATCGCNWNHLS